MKIPSILIIFILLIPFFGVAQKNHFDKKPFVKGEMLIQLVANKSLRPILLKAPSEYDVKFIKELSKPMRISLISFDYSSVSHEKFQSWLYSQDEITVADYNYYVKMRSTLPSDPSFTSQWHHNNIGNNGGTVDADIDSDLAWDITTGGTTATNDDIVVCMVEGDGGNLDHLDLSPNRWVNNGEIPNDNIDNDGNGYVDDFNGWNTGTNDDDYGNSGHGTNCLGMIGAKGNNNIDVAGANWDVKMMVLNMGGNLTQANVVSAYTYPLIMRQMWNSSNGSQGAFVVATSASWGIDNADPSSYPLWCQFYDTLGHYGILNVGATTNSNLDVDVAGDMPTGCTSNYMIGVGRTDNQDQTAGGYGDQTILLGAPGINVVTTDGSGAGASGITSTTGTSFACPLTAGVIGLAYSIPCPSFMPIVRSNPKGAADLVLQALINGTDPKTQLSSKFITGGRLNSRNTIDNLMADVCSGNICLNPNNINTSNITDSSANIQFNSFSSASSTTFYWREDGAPIWNIVPNANSPLSLTNLIGCSDYEFYLESICGSDTSNQNNIQSFSTFGCGNCIDLAYCTSAASDAVDEWIDTLIIGADSLITGNNNGYGNFTSSISSIDLTEGQTYNISISPGWSGTVYDERSRIWIDLNQNGNFDPAELLYDQGSATQTIATGTLTVPLNTISGNTRMRVQMAYIGGTSTLPEVCDQFTWGEVEDYCVNIMQARICGMNVVSTVNNPQCSGVDNGNISVSVSGDSPGYTYNWAGSLGNDSVLNNLSAGNFSLIISDSSLCDTNVNYTLNYLPSGLNVLSTVNNPQCLGIDNGNVSVSVSGGVPGYNYSWGTSSVTDTILENLSPGIYSLFVSDSLMCDTSLIYDLTYLTTIDFSSSIDNITCKGGNDGEIAVTPLGSAGYNFIWSGSFGNNSAITGLSPGIYTLDLSDTNGCSKSGTFTITEPSPIQLQASFNSSINILSVNFDNTSNNGSFSWDFGDGTSSSSYEAVHNYDSYGNYNVCLTLFTDCDTVTYCDTITIEDFTSDNIKDDFKNGIKIYPNPASNTVYFSINNPKASNIYIIDATGKIVENRVIRGPVEEMNLDNYSSGIYTCQITNKLNELIKSSRLNIIK